MEETLPYRSAILKDLKTSIAALPPFQAKMHNFEAEDSRSIQHPAGDEHDERDEGLSDSQNAVIEEHGHEDDEGDGNDRNDDHDSSYSNDQPSTDSLSPSVFEYEQENGRTYQNGKYLLPNDEREQERMDIHYASLQHVLSEKHFIAPIARPTAILDVGTGTGIWAMDVADEYSHATVIGTDLSPIQPKWTPPNLEWLILDCNKPWEFRQQFDLVHTRFMNYLSVRSWLFFYEQAFECIKPGGWIENQECAIQWQPDDGSFPDDSAVQEWQQALRKGIASLGFSAHIDPMEMKEQMAACGFINVHLEEYKMQVVGDWPEDPSMKKAGGLNLLGLMYGIGGISSRIFSQGLCWDAARTEALLMRVRKEWESQSMHTYMPIYVLYGQKPITT